MIEQALQNAKFNKNKAAKALGLTRLQLYIHMRLYAFEAYSQLPTPNFQALCWDLRPELASGNTFGSW
jgi:hypothetical protein